MRVLFCLSTLPLPCGCYPGAFACGQYALPGRNAAPLQCIGSALQFNTSVHCKTSEVHMLQTHCCIAVQVQCTLHCSEKGASGEPYTLQVKHNALRGRVQCTLEWSAMHCKRSVSPKCTEVCTSVHWKYAALRSGLVLVFSILYIEFMTSGHLVAKSDETLMRPLLNQLISKSSIFQLNPKSKIAY